jgi:sugar phosphate isomerase/epimerase
MQGNHGISRRLMLTASGSAIMAAGFGKPALAQKPEAPARVAGAFRFCLNTGTIRELKLPIDQEVEVAAKAGYDAIEPWVDNVNRYRDGGGSLADLRKKIADLGLTVESAIGFPNWVVDDEAARAKGLEQMKRDMETVAAIGGKRIAAPPAGVNRAPGLDLRKAGERYRAVLELGDQAGVVPELEIWGSSANLSRLSEAVFVALESGHPKACVLADLFHMYKGGSGFDGLKLLSAGALPVFHMNDYPADPPIEKITDAARVYPGDGIAPMTRILRDLAAKGGAIVLSLELFNREYQKSGGATVAKTGLEKMKAAVAKALA